MQWGGGNGINWLSIDLWNAVTDEYNRWAPERMTCCCIIPEFPIIDGHGEPSSRVSLGTGSAVHNPHLAASEASQILQTVSSELLRLRTTGKFSWDLLEEYSDAWENVDSILARLLGYDIRFQLKFCWGQSNCTVTNFKTRESGNKFVMYKEIKKLSAIGGYDESNTLLVDDTPYKAYKNPPNTAIFPNTYNYKNLEDDSLGDLRVYLEGLALAENVQEYVKNHPFGQRPLVGLVFTLKFFSTRLACIEEANENIQLISRGTKYCSDHWVTFAQSNTEYMIHDNNCGFSRADTSHWRIIGLLPTAIGIPKAIQSGYLSCKKTKKNIPQPEDSISSTYIP
ncbi:hypothetical protein POM88_052784 [Heracleum sosnowskyi]|uniref:Mitochondrial import inner membrane translocase subunit TIM50 n=1 Tax=Heracleum sosnowskyi TaxID=360622 RepID=A0AAD8GRX1_9APIA|nr:hypothetical protein POM88_052784 [Heracleum sosnowskyi]